MNWNLLQRMENQENVVSFEIVLSYGLNFAKQDKPVEHEHEQSSWTLHA